MDLSLTRDIVRINEPVFDAGSEHPVDCDIILPDYCPDIGRVLKTKADAYIDTKILEPGRLTINGTFSVKIIYVPENAYDIRCFSYEMPFNHSIDCRDDDKMAFSNTSVRVAFVNCRPVGPRRFQVRASLAINAKIWTQRDEEFISGCEGNQIEMLRKPMLESMLVGRTERTFPIQEELEIGYGKPDVASVVKSDAVAVVSDYKVISNKVMLKGELLIKTLYCLDENENSGGLETMEHSIPISQIIDMEGVDEDCLCDIKLEQGIVKAEPKQNADGQNRNLDFSVNITAVINAWKSRELNAACDAYNPLQEVILEQKEIPFIHIADHIKTSEMLRLSIDLADTQFSSIMDLSAVVNSANSKIENSELAINGEMAVSILAMDTSGTAMGIDRAIPFTIRQEIRNACGQGMNCETEVKVISAGYSLSGVDRVDLRIECAIEAMLFCSKKENVITDLKLTDNLKEQGNKKALTLYYADKGERIWDIAKRYNTSMEDVKRENKIDADYLEDRCMLLIPKKRGAMS